MLRNGGRNGCEMGGRNGAKYASDARSSPNDQIAHAAKVIGKSKHRAAVFKAIYEGKKKVKSVKEIHEATSLSRIRVLQEGGKLTANQVVHPTKKNGMTAYEKDSFFGAQKAKILSQWGTFI